MSDFDPDAYLSGDSEFDPDKYLSDPGREERAGELLAPQLRDEAAMAMAEEGARKMRQLEKQKVARQLMEGGMPAAEAFHKAEFGLGLPPAPGEGRGPVVLGQSAAGPKQTPMEPWRAAVIGAGTGVVDAMAPPGVELGDFYGGTPAQSMGVRPAGPGAGPNERELTERMMQEDIARRRQIHEMPKAKVREAQKEGFAQHPLAYGGGYAGGLLLGGAADVVGPGAVQIARSDAFAKKLAGEAAEKAQIQALREVGQARAREVLARRAAGMPVPATPEQVAAKMRSQTITEPVTQVADEFADTIPSSTPGHTAQDAIGTAASSPSAKLRQAARPQLPPGVTDINVVVTKDLDGRTLLKSEAGVFPFDTPNEVRAAQEFFDFHGTDSVTVDPAINPQEGVNAVAALTQPPDSGWPGLLDEPWRAKNLAEGREARLVPGTKQHYPYLVPGEEATNVSKVVSTEPESQSIFRKTAALKTKHPDWVQDFADDAVTEKGLKLADYKKIAGGEDWVPPVGGGSGKPPVDLPPGVKLDDPRPPAVQAKAADPSQLDKNIRAPDVIPPQAVAKVTLDEVAHVQKLMGAANKANQPDLPGRILDGVLHDIHRGPRELRERLQQMVSAPALNRADEIIRPFELRLPDRNLFHKAAFDLKKFQQGQLTVEQLAKSLPEKNRQHFLSFAEQIKSEIAENDKWFKARGLGAASQLPENKLAPYLGRFYYTFMLPKGKWAKIIEKAPPGSSPHTALQDMMDFLVQDAAKHGETLTPEKLSFDLLNVLRAEDPLDFMSKNASDVVHQKAFDRLLKRKDLPEVFRRFLGEEQNGAISMAYTLAHQRQLRAQVTAWDSLAQDVASGKMPPVLSTTPVPGWIPVEDKFIYGAAAGQFAHPSLRAALAAPKTLSNGLMIGQKLTKWLKFSQVIGGGPKAFVNNFMRNVWGGLLSGLIEAPWNLPKTGRAMKQAVAELAAYAKNPAGDSIVLEARKYGALSAPFGRTEIAEDSYMRKLIAHVYDKSKDSPDMWAPMDALVDKIYRAKDKTTAAYDLIDQFWKLSSYIKLKNEKLAGGWSPEDAARFAAQRINDSYPNFEHLGHVIDKARRLPIGVNRYLSGHTEELRVLALLPRRLREEPEFIGQQMLYGAGYLGGMMGGLWGMRQLAGIPNQEIKQIESELTKQEQTYAPMRVYLPMRDENGAPISMEMSQWFTPFQLMYGHPDDIPVAKMSANILLNSFDDVSGDNVRKFLFENTGILKPVQRDPHLIQSEATLIKGAQEAWKTGWLGPTFTYKTMQAAQEAEWFNATGRQKARLSDPVTPGVAAARIFLPVQKPHKAGGKNKAAQAVEYGKSELFGIGGPTQSIRSIAGSTRDTNDKKKLIKKEAADIREQSKMFRSRKESK